MLLLCRMRSCRREVGFLSSIRCLRNLTGIDSLILTPRTRLLLSRLVVCFVVVGWCLLVEELLFEELLLMERLVIERYHLQGLRKAESEVESDEVVESGEVV